MKNLTLLLIVLFSLHTNAQVLQGADMAKVATIKADGTVLDESDKLAGHIKKDGMVTDKQSVITGYIKADGTIEDRTHAAVGYVQPDGTVLDKDKKQLGVIKDGVVSSPSGETIGYAKGVNVKWAAVYFFFLF